MRKRPDPHPQLFDWAIFLAEFAPPWGVSPWFFGWRKSWVCCAWSLLSSAQTRKRSAVDGQVRPLFRVGEAAGKLCEQPASNKIVELVLLR